MPRAMTRPARMNSSSSQRSASSMTWLDTTIVVPASASARKWPQNWTRSSGSTPTVGSSRNSTAGWWISAHASDRRRRWPPDSVPGHGVLAVASSTRASASTTAASPRDAVGGREEPRVLADGERRVDPVALGHVPDPGERRARRHRRAQHLRVAGGRVGHPGQQPDERGLARSVGPEQAVDPVPAPGRSRRRRPRSSPRTA